MIANRTLIAGICAATGLALIAAPLDAQRSKKRTRPPVAAPAPAVAPAPIVSPEQQRAEANAAQAKAAQDQMAQNAANQQAYQDAVKAREAAIAKQQADHAAAVKQWEADVAACKAGDASKCAKPN